MKLLVLGGTVFLGRHVTECALARGHDVTLFHRGHHGADLFPAVERIIGDRDGGLDALHGRTWDAVVDTSGYVPRIVGASARTLASSCGFYAFVSSVSVYSDFSQVAMTEDAPVGVLDDTSTEEITGETYGPLKALCEQAVADAFGTRCAIVRPGLIVGPCDPSDRFTYWPARLDRGGEVLAPGNPDRPVQFIDARDLASWIVDLCERAQSGTYNAVGPGHRYTFGELLDECRRASGQSATLTWVPDAFLIAQGVEPWTGLPLWIPDDANMSGLETVSGTRAYGAGLRCRSVGETVADTLAWHRSRPSDITWRAGISEERERAVLDTWHASMKTDEVSA